MNIIFTIIIEINVLSISINIFLYFHFPFLYNIFSEYIIYVDTTIRYF